MASEIVTANEWNECRKVTVSAACETATLHFTSFSSARGDKHGVTANERNECRVPTFVEDGSLYCFLRPPHFTSFHFVSFAVTEGDVSFLCCVICSDGVECHCEARSAAVPLLS